MKTIRKKTGTVLLMMMLFLMHGSVYAEETVPEEEITEEETPDEEDMTEEDPQREFVQRMYETVLLREGDESGIEDWVSRLKSGQATGCTVITGFFESREMRLRNTDDTEYVKTAYRAILGREADESGLSVWTQALRDGMSRRYVLAGFASGTEFSNLCARYGIEKGTLSKSLYRDRNPVLTRFVSRLYTEALGRAWDADGLEYWCRRLYTKTDTAASAVSGFLFSAEFAAKDLSDAEFTAVCYRVFFGREADEAGMKHWCGILDTGMTRRYVVKAFAGSAEFRTLARQNGIEAGTLSVSAYRDRNEKMTAFAAGLYTGILGRKGREENIENYAKKLYLKTLNGKAAVTAFFASAEYNKKTHTDEEYVRQLYAGALGRQPSLAETESAVNRLKKGTSRKALMNSVLDSAEFTSRCKAAGIVPRPSSAYAVLDVSMSDISIAGFGGYTLPEDSLKMLRAAVNTVEGRGYRISFVLLDIASGKGIAYHPDYVYYSASVLKAPYIVSLAKYNYSGYAAMRTAAANVLRTSDNAGYAALWAAYHGSSFARFGKEAGVPAGVCADMYTNLSARQLAKLWLASDTYFRSSVQAGSVGALMENPVTTSIRRILPSGIKTRSKAGWFAGGWNVTHDAGIVYASNGRFVLAVMSAVPARPELLDPVIWALYKAHEKMK